MLHYAKESRENISFLFSLWKEYVSSLIFSVINLFRLSSIYLNFFPDSLSLIYVLSFLTSDSFFLIFYVIMSYVFLSFYLCKENKIMSTHLYHARNKLISNQHCTNTETRPSENESWGRTNEHERARSHVLLSTKLISSSL